MDAVANIVRDLVITETQLPILLNAVHPHPIPWKQVMNDINSCLFDRPLAVVPYSQWVEELVRVARNATAEGIERVVSSSLRSSFEYISHNNSSPLSNCLNTSGHLVLIGVIYTASQKMWSWKPEALQCMTQSNLESSAPRCRTCLR